MRSAGGGGPRVAQRQLDEDARERELHRAESENSAGSYNKTDKQQVVTTTVKLAIVKARRWIIMLKAWSRANADAPRPLEPHPPRRSWPFRLLLLFLMPVLLLAFLSSYSWLTPLIQQKRRVTADDEIAVLLYKYGLLTDKTQFGETLIPTPWQQMHSPMGPDIYRLERAIQIFNCSTSGPMRSNSTNVHTPIINQAFARETAAANGTTAIVSEACPSYFSWILADLAPWKQSGISRTALEMGKKYAAFRAIILNGVLYIDLYYACFQTRVLFTVWGLLLLLEKYKNGVPDVEIMFNCMDRPRARADATHPVPLFSYCSNREFSDIPWPDWSFWGWSELQMESWDQEYDKIAKGSKTKDWTQKVKKAYWRGNPFVRHAPYREQLLLCKNKTKDSKVDVAIQVRHSSPKPSIVRQDNTLLLRLDLLDPKEQSLVQLGFLELDSFNRTLHVTGLEIGACNRKKKFQTGKPMYTSGPGPANVVVITMKTKKYVSWFPDLRDGLSTFQNFIRRSNHRLHAVIYGVDLYLLLWGLVILLRSFVFDVKWASAQLSQEALPINRDAIQYMVYVEGVTWSVSLKYMMACGSPTMVVSPNYYDFYMRGLQPDIQYIRVQPENSCVSKLCTKLNEEVDHAELNPSKAEAVGKTGQAFVGKEVSMGNVYDYMFHMLHNYAKLQKFNPRISQSAHLVTQDYILCLAQPLQRLLLIKAQKLLPSSAAPCFFPEDQKAPRDFGWEAFKHVNKKC